MLNLNRVYAANPNAVGMQVYAGAMVYAAMRVAQAEVGRRSGSGAGADLLREILPQDGGSLS